MAVNKPVFYDKINKTFAQLNDAQLERMSYAIRKWFALELSAASIDNIPGKISIGIPGETGFTDIGTATNTITREVTLTGSNDDVPPSDLNFPSTLSSSYHINFKNSWTYRQKDPNIDDYISYDDIKTYSYLFWNNTLKGLQLEGNETNMIDTIVGDARYQIQYGDRVGGYHIGTSAPSDGGVWVNKGTIFTDTSYWNAATNFQLYLKTSAANENTILYSSSTEDSLLQFDGVVNGSPILTNMKLSDYEHPVYTRILASVLEFNGPKYTLSKISGNDSTVDSTTWVNNYSNTNYGFITERFVLSGYDQYLVQLYSAQQVYTGAYYQVSFRPQNNSYRYNVWALIPNGHY